MSVYTPPTWKVNRIEIFSQNGILIKEYNGLFEIVTNSDTRLSFKTGVRLITVIKGSSTIILSE